MVQNNPIPTELNSCTDLQKAFFKHTIQRYEILAPNIYLAGHEMDLLGIRRSGYIDEVEIKISVSDFRADFKKMVAIKSDYKCIVSESFSHHGYPDVLKHKAINQGKLDCNYFSFYLTEDIADKCEIPEYAGLYVGYLDKEGIVRVKEVKRAPLLHKNKISELSKYHVARKMVFRYWDSIKANCIY